MGRSSMKFKKWKGIRLVDATPPKSLHINGLQKESAGGWGLDTPHNPLPPCEVAYPTPYPTMRPLVGGGEGGWGSTYRGINPHPSLAQPIDLQSLAPAFILRAWACAIRRELGQNVPVCKSFLTVQKLAQTPQTLASQNFTSDFTNLLCKTLHTKTSK